MFGLIKMIFGAVFFGIMAYGFFFIDLGGQTMASHAADIWSAPVVQEKVDKVRDGLKEEIEERLAEAGRKAGDQAGRQIARAATESSKDEITDSDREALAELIEETTQKN